MQQQTRQQTTSPWSSPAPSGVRASLINLDVVGAVLAAAEVGIWQLFAAGPRLLASSTALSILGLEDGEALEPDEDALCRVHPADRERVAGELARSRSEAGPFALEMRLLTTTGETQWVYVHGTSVHGETGFEHACGTVQDVTARKEQELLRELLLVTLGHDLRNPLTAIQIGAGLLLRRGQLGESDSNTAQRVLASAGRISAMVEQLLDFTRIRVSGSLPCSCRPGNLGILAARAIDELESEHPRRNHRAVVRRGSRRDMGRRSPRSDGPQPGLERDRARGRELARHHPDHVPRRRRGARRPQRGPPCACWTRWTGRSTPCVGWPTRQRRPASASGSSSSMRIVRAHGGTMQVASSAQDGTRFSVVLPRQVESTR